VEVVCWIISIIARRVVFIPIHQTQIARAIQPFVFMNMPRDTSEISPRQLHLR
jgi:hypothetical protein